MGGYINIGVAAPQKTFKKSVLCFFKKLNSFFFHEVYFPNKDYVDWTSLNSKECSSEEVVNYCLKNEMAYFIGEFMLGYITIKNAVFTVETRADGMIGLVIKIPEAELLSDIDISEFCIKELFKKLSGFSFAFCDSEAHLDDDKYSIYVQYRDEPLFSYESWKIDGLTER